MKKQGLILLFTMLAFSCGQNEQKEFNTGAQRSNKTPIPTQVYDNLENEEEFEEKRDNYFNLIHGNHPEWRTINASILEEQAFIRTKQLTKKTTEFFAEGALEGEWFERGSKNVPGNIRICDYHPTTEDVYVISDGGILWKGNLDGETWTTLNDGIQLGKRILKVVDLPDGTVRILAANTHKIKYSDDLGMNWTDATGFVGTVGTGNALYQLNDASKTLVYLYRRGSSNEIAYSTDNGESFTFVDNLDASGQHFVSMHVPPGSATAYILDHNDDIYTFEGTTLTLVSTDQGFDGSNRCMIRAIETEGTTTIYTLLDNSKLYRSNNGGIDFEFVSTLDVNTWEVGIQVSADNPEIVYAGDVNLRKSTDGGVTFVPVSEWWEYYDDVENKIHADIMAISTFKKLDGETFTLIANHGGISVSYDYLATTPNIAMEDLNTGQFYDVLSDPNDPKIIYGGTQDQGFQRTTNGGTSTPSDFDQIISGDYGAMQFTNNGENIWIQYPGAWFQLYTNAETDESYSHSIDIDGTTMPNVDWIVPTGSAPHPEDNYIYIGGGNLSGGSGSFLIKATYTGTGIETSQFSFNFSEESGAAISAIETTPLNDEFIYVVTENGRFFRSENEGASFTMTPSYYGPSGGFIYTADIYASRKTPGLVYVGGSNYGSSSVWMSTDSAKTFSPIGEGLPNTTVHEMVMNPSEQFLFAATDAGPYAFNMETEEWHNISGTTAPIQEYISVEFIPSSYMVRYATWGRGIWDFDISSVAGIEEEKEQQKLSVYPNPSNSDHVIQVDLPENGNISVYDLKGNRVFNKVGNLGNNLIDLSQIESGVYIVAFIGTTNEVQTRKIILR